MSKLTLKKDVVSNIISIHKHAREIPDYVQMLLLLNTEDKKQQFEKCFARIQFHLAELKKLNLDLEYDND